MLFLLGILDILAGVTLFTLKFSSFFLPIAFLFGVYLIIKSLIFFKTFASVIDILVGIIIILATLGEYNILTYLSIVWLLQKGLLSLF